MVGVNPSFTMLYKIYEFGVTDSTLFNGNTKSDRMAAELFDDQFLSCMDNTYE